MLRKGTKLVAMPHLKSGGAQKFTGLVSAGELFAPETALVQSVTALHVYFWDFSNFFLLFL